MYHSPDRQKYLLSIKLRLFFYPSVETCVLCAQKNRLIETDLFSTHNICFGCEIRKLDLSRRMRFLTMWYVRPVKPQISLRIRTV